jgi:hypothetical protein
MSMRAPHTPMVVVGSSVGIYHAGNAVIAMARLASTRFGALRHAVLYTVEYNDLGGAGAEAKASSVMPIVISLWIFRYQQRFSGEKPCDLLRVARLRRLHRFLF